MLASCWYHSHLGSVKELMLLSMLHKHFGSSYNTIFAGGFAESPSSVVEKEREQIQYKHRCMVLHIPCSVCIRTPGFYFTFKANQQDLARLTAQTPRK